LEVPLFDLPLEGLDFEGGIHARVFFFFAPLDDRLF
jgi:hypothetical protein